MYVTEVRFLDRVVFSAEVLVTRSREIEHAFPVYFQD